MSVRFPNSAFVMRCAFACLFLAFLLPLISAAVPQKSNASKPAAEKTVPAVAQSESPAPAVPKDRYDRGTPRRAVVAWSNAIREKHFEDAAHYLDLTRFPEEERAARGPELARELDLVLDQQGGLDTDTISDDPSGDLNDGLAPDREMIAKFPGDPRDVKVMLARIPREDGVLVWVFSPRFVSHVPALAEQYGQGPLAAHLPHVLVDTQFLDVALWQWIGIVVLLVAAWILAWVVSGLLMRILTPLAKRSRTDIDDQLVAFVAGPSKLLFGIGFFKLGMKWLHLSVPAKEFVADASKVLIVFAVTWFAFRATDLLASVVRRRLEKHHRAGATSLVPWGARTIKVAIGTVMVLASLDTFGVHVTAVLAGLGVGGLAVALAAQKTLENVFGGVSVLVDQPVRPGDFCKFGDQVGTVEDIGMRSTRIRTLDRTVVAIPNSVFSNMQLENYAQRDRIRLVTTLGLRYETTADQLRHVIIALRGVLVAHPKVLPDPLRVRFTGFGAYSLDLEVYAYVATSDYNEFLAVREDLFLRMMEVVAENGTGFAFPSSTTYFTRDQGIDEERAKEVVGEVEAWRKSGRLAMPDFSQKEVEEIDGSIDWPPKGSVLRNGK